MIKETWQQNFGLPYLKELLVLCGKLFYTYFESVLIRDVNSNHQISKLAVILDYYRYTCYVTYRVTRTFQSVIQW